MLETEYYLSRWRLDTTHLYNSPTQNSTTEKANNAKYSKTKLTCDTRPGQFIIPNHKVWERPRHYLSLTFITKHSSPIRVTLCVSIHCCSVKHNIPVLYEGASNT